MFWPSSISRRRAPPWRRGVEAMSSIGKPVAHDSAREHVRGEAAYLVDLPPLRGELTVDFVGSPVAHGRIKSIDVAAAKAAEGIVAVFTAADVPGDNHF